MDATWSPDSAMHGTLLAEVAMLGKMYHEIDPDDKSGGEKA